MSAFDLERVVIDRLGALLEDRDQIYSLMRGQVTEACEIQSALRAAEILAAKLRTGSVTERLTIFNAIKPHVQLFDDRVVVALRADSVCGAIGFNEAAPDDHVLELVCHIVRVRRGHEIKLVIPGSASPLPTRPSRDERMVALLAEAQAAKELVLASPQYSINRIAIDAGRCRTRLAKLFSLSHLAPSIVTAIIEGRQPGTLTRQRLLDVDLPMDWTAQRAALGFA